MHPVDKMFNDAFQPFRKDTGTPYPSRQSDIDFHKKSSFTTTNKGPWVNETDATEFMMLHNSLTKRARSSEQAAIDRFASAVSDFHRHGRRYGPDLPIKAFADLDEIFFGGYLGRNVCLSWSSNETDKRLAVRTCHAKPGAMMLGITERRGNCGEIGQCRIILNAEAIFNRGSSKDPFEQMMGTVLHEMVHAYDIVRCPMAVELFGDGFRHDAHFETRLAVIHDRARRLMRLKVIGDDEDYRQKIFFTKELKPPRDERRKHRSRR